MSLLRGKQVALIGGQTDCPLLLRDKQVIVEEIGLGTNRLSLLRVKQVALLGVTEQIAFI